MFLKFLRAAVLVFLVLPVVSVAQAPANDLCSAASTLTPGTTCTYTTGSLHRATTGAPTNSRGSTYDVWYRFTMPANSTSVDITVPTPGGGSSITAANTFLEVFGTSSCPAAASTNIRAIGGTLSFTDLTPGSTYFMRVFTTSDPTVGNANKWDFTICVAYYVKPDNDDCSGATLLTSANICTNTSGTLDQSTTSTAVAASCVAGTSYFDVWYKFTAASTQHTATISSRGSNFTNPAVQIFGGTCASLSPLACGTTSVTATGLTIGTTYFVRVSNVGSRPITNGSFSICINHPAPPPANDECSAATSLTVGSSTVSGTVYGATNSGLAATCSGTPDDDVWYRFTATASATNITMAVSGASLTSSGAQLQVFSGTCGTLTSAGCLTGAGTLALTNLIAGNAYFIRVYGSGTGSIGTSTSDAGFTIGVSVPASLPASSVVAGRMNEVFQQTVLSGGNLLNDPWEVTYGADGFLWITEAKGYKLYRMDPNTGAKTTVLDVSQGSTFLPAADQTFNVQFSSTFNPWPQGGFAGLALHPKFLDATAPKNFVYVSYVRSYDSTAANNAGVFFTNRVVRFTYNTATGKCESPVSLCDTLPGSSDHNSQRMIIAPVSGTDYLFYASGDMGSGQFGNSGRAIRSQADASYEGKILRFNLEPDVDAGTLDKWIPNDNPFNGARQSAVWSTGMRNNQGFAYATINGTGYLYGSSHGPFSDDELNIIERGKNYGHPNVIGFAADGNYNGVKAGSATGTLPLISSESANATAIGSSYKDPFYSAYAASNAAVTSIYNNQTNNGAWPSEGWSGLDVYTSSAIPGWRNSLVIGSLKWGRVLRFKLNTAGSGVTASGTQDTVGYFGSTNRFRDVAVGPDGRDLYVIMDKSSTTSGPTAGSPVVSACPGCVHKYTFLGYANDASGKSGIPNFIGISTGDNNTCVTASQVTINSTNNNLWVPITGPDGNILAEIRANGNNLGTVSTSAYYYTGTARQDAATRLYGSRSLTITPQTQPSSPVSIRLYLSTSEFAAMQTATNSSGRSSGINSIADLAILKNNDPCSSAMSAAHTSITPIFAEAFGTGGYVLQANISSFSSFYFGNPNMEVLPLRLVNFTGTWQNNKAQLQWSTASESHTSMFVVERSADGQAFHAVGTVQAAGNSSTTQRYSFTDANAAAQQQPVLYYRLKMLDADGAYTYSNVVTIVVPVRSDIVVFPTPVTHTLNIRLNSVGRVPLQVIVTDIQGREVYQQSGLPTNGLVKIDVQQWKPQLYIIKITNQKGEVIAIQKFQKI